VSNLSGLGSKLEARAGSLVQKLESYSAWPSPAPADLTFGLGKRDAVDAVRILWPLESFRLETEIPKSKSSLFTLKVELDRKRHLVRSLYTWNGERFEFITDSWAVRWVT
jgi:hypothetical protein